MKATNIVLFVSMLEGYVGIEERSIFLWAKNLDIFNIDEFEQ